jgi:hypothetical protein
MDYHWDHYFYFIIPPLSHTDYDSLLISIVTCTSTPTSSIWIVTHTDSLLVLVLVVFAFVKWDRCLKVFRAFRVVKGQSLTTLNTSHFTDVICKKSRSLANG